MIRKSYLIIASLTIVLSSCLKQSIPDAMSDEGGGVTATLSYKVNGSPVEISVPDARSQTRNFYQLICEKGAYYVVSGLSNAGQTTLTFYTDSLMLINYEYPSLYGDLFVLDYNQSAFVHGPNDYMSYNITSYSDGLVSGNFSGRLTPLVSAGNPNNIFGTPGSLLVTDGLFKNVPVLY